MSQGSPCLALGFFPVISLRSTMLQRMQCHQPFIIDAGQGSLQRWQCQCQETQRSVAVRLVKRLLTKSLKLSLVNL